ncbi:MULTISPECIES: IclR family transcriptional regulator [Arthrobacter]|uniref:Glycerol operon regulatory protein n=1 Tax=Arthrobacter terricola TaxID=2547396 RepID=A0A4V2ZRW8_9MICC|nr:MULTISPECIES: IclR family transcriptional regulator [Arthrobacter]MBT8163292.1 IclR family transcriptional regulator [Arthrobacter sp. GN70]TDF90984.1 IclR family transcriptional regulator [Arthrobacter terricola]
MTVTHDVGSFADDRATPDGLLQTADRALQVLLHFDGLRTEWGVTEVAEEFGFNKSIAQRLLATLAHRGFLIADPDTRRYRIGPSAMTLGHAWERSGSLRAIVDPILRELSARTDATAILALPDNLHMRAVAAVDGSSGPLRVYPLVGELYPAHAGATSKAFYAYLPAQQRQLLFAGRPIARFTDRTVTDASALEAEFLRIRQQGYASTVGEYDSHVAVVAVLVSVRGEPYGSLSLGGPEESFVNPEQHVPLLRHAAQQIERRLTGRPRTRKD